MAATTLRENYRSRPGLLSLEEPRMKETRRIARTLPWLERVRTMREVPPICDRYQELQATKVGVVELR